MSWEVATKANKWQGRNITRWQNEEYDEAFKAAEIELDPVKRAALFIKMNDLVVGDQVVIPVSTARASRRSQQAARPTLSGWDNDTWEHRRDWYREA